MLPSFLGVDPSLTGFAYRKAVGEQSYGFGIRTKPKAFPSFPARLDFMTSEFRRFLSEHGSTIQLAAIEGFSMGNKQGSSKSIEIGAVGMMARVELWRAGIPFLEVPPSTLKKWISGKGNAEKNLMLRAVYQRWGFEAETDDDADAYALMKLAERWCRVEPPATKKDGELWGQVKKACTMTMGNDGL